MRSEADREFVFRPASHPERHVERARILLRIAAAVTVTAALGALVTWAIGFLVNSHIAGFLIE